MDKGLDMTLNSTKVKRTILLLNLGHGKQCNDGEIFIISSRVSSCGFEGEMSTRFVAILRERTTNLV